MLDRGSVRLRHALHCYARRSFAEVIHKALFKNYTLKLRCKMETYQETSKVNATRFGVGGVHVGLARGGVGQSALAAERDVSAQVKVSIIDAADVNYAQECKSLLEYIKSN